MPRKVQWQITVGLFDTAVTIAVLLIVAATRSMFSLAAFAKQTVAFFERRVILDCDVVSINRLIFVEGSLLSFSNIISVFSLLVAIGSAGTTIYYNFIWRPEDVRVNFRLEERDALGKGPVQVRLLFSNLGKQSVLVEDVSLIEIIGRKLSLESCAEDIDFSVLAKDRNIMMLAPLEGARVTNHSAKIIDPRKNEGRSFPIAIEPNNVQQLLLEFSTYNIPDLKSASSEYRIVHCLGLKFYDKNGRIYFRSIKAWLFSAKYNDFANDNDAIRILPSIDADKALSNRGYAR